MERGNGGMVMADNTTTEYRIVEGELISVSDGDTANFVARGMEWVTHLPEGGKPNGTGGYLRLRFQGIDTPELHYPPPRSCFVEEAAKRRGVPLFPLPTVMYEQPMGKEAGDALKGLTGFNNLDVHYVPAFVLTRGADGYGRMIAYILLASDVDNLVHNTTTLVGEDLLKRTLNYKMLANGMAYYTGYGRMPAEHRRTFIDQANESRSKGRGLWKDAPTPTAPFSLVDEGSLGRKGTLILPKLFRRCIAYLFAVNADDYRGDLTDWMQRSRLCAGAEKSDMVKVRHQTEPVPFDELIECHGETVRLTEDPTDLLFLEAPDSAFPSPPATDDDEDAAALDESPAVPSTPM
jgi:endonuclease YncB( thermonuclease family)